MLQHEGVDSADEALENQFSDLCLYHFIVQHEDGQIISKLYLHKNTQ